MDMVRPWLAPAALLLAATLGGYGVKAVVVRRLRALFEKTETRLDDLLLEALGRHLPLWFVLAGLAAATQAAPLAAAHQSLIQRVVVAGFFVSVTLALSKFASGAVRLYAVEFTASTAATSLAENLVRIAVIAMGAMLLLSNLGISITPVLTALGVGSLAVALALQDTLSNLFSGIHIVGSRMIEVGDYIKLDSGQEGFVVDIGWRTTCIRELPNNLILIPNAKLSQAVITNYQRPEPELAVIVEMGIAYGSDLGKAERVAMEVGPYGVSSHSCASTPSRIPPSTSRWSCAPRPSRTAT